MVPVYFADYWARESEFAPLREAIRMYTDPQRGVEPAPYDVRGQLGAISTRTLAMVGRYDAICAPYWSQMLAERMPNAEMVILEQSGHFGHVEELETFARTISAFVR
jgi:proline iminopeptidase